MRKLAAPVFLLLLFLVLAPIIAAQTNQSPKTLKTEVRSNLTERRASAAADLRAKKEAALQDFKAKRVAAAAEFRAKRKEALATFKIKRQEAKEAFKLRLNKIKDEAKKEIAENLEENLNTINQRHTEHFSDRLEKFSNFLERIISRKDKAKESGMEVTTVETAIAAAETAITNAETAVATQSGKVYTINFTTEANLRTAAESARKTLRADLKSTHDKVTAARKAVVDSMQALAAINGVDSAP